MLKEAGAQIESAHESLGKVLHGNKAVNPIGGSPFQETWDACPGRTETVMKSTLQLSAERPLGGRAGLKRTLMRPTTVLPALVAVLLLGSTVPASAAIGIEVEIAPPPVPTVVVPAPRAGFVWAPGYWRWDGQRHVWAEGRWIRARPGFHWVPEHWVPRRGHYRFVQGHWARG